MLVGHMIKIPYPSLQGQGDCQGHYTSIWWNLPLLSPVSVTKLTRHKVGI